MKRTDPQTLLEVVQYFSDEKHCVDFLSSIKWEDGIPCCPQCGSLAVTRIKSRPIWQCKEKDCRKQFGIKMGTIFEKSLVPLTKWLPCLFMLGADRNGISSCEVARALGVNQKTAWFMLHRVRKAMDSGSIMLSGQVEIDETYLGGKNKNRHPYKKLPSTGGLGKTIIFGGVERGGRAKAHVIHSHQVEPLQQEVRNLVEEGSDLFTDAHAAYRDGISGYRHQMVDHSREFVRGEAHTNSIENFWSCFKRAVRGTYISIAPFHTDKYLDEQAFRFNHKGESDYVRFYALVCSVFGKRLTWKELTTRE